MPTDVFNTYNKISTRKVPKYGLANFVTVHCSGTKQEERRISHRCLNYSVLTSVAIFWQSTFNLLGVVTQKAFTHIENPQGGGKPRAFHPYPSKAIAGINAFHAYLKGDSLGENLLSAVMLIARLRSLSREH